MASGNFSWLGAARIHRSTVDALAQHTSVLPLKLATVHRDQELLAAMVAAHHQHFTDVLTSLAGQQEWEVTVYALPVEEPPIPPLPQATRSDQAFLPVHDQSYDAGHHQREALAAADRLHRKLTGLATASRRHPQSRARLTDEPGTTISSTAYLVRRDQAEALHPPGQTPGTTSASTTSVRLLLLRRRGSGSGSGLPLLGLADLRVDRVDLQLQVDYPQPLSIRW
ncbi:GvpL/GvpF family gas vesicle protein [Streptomyces sp. PA03-1a]|nr:GvpL/GvpF family gas vesicle protein [Streptomyces sp. PA03-1a]